VVKISIRRDGITIECSADEMDKVLKNLDVLMKQAGSLGLRIDVKPSGAEQEEIPRAVREHEWMASPIPVIPEDFWLPEDILTELFRMGLRRALIQTLVALLMANDLYQRPVSMDYLLPFLRALGADRDVSNNYRYLKELVSMGFVVVERGVVGRSKNHYRVNYEKVPSSLVEHVKKFLKRFKRRKEGAWPWP